MDLARKELYRAGPSMVCGRHATAAAGFFLGFLVCGVVGAAEIRVEGTCTLIDAILAANADAVSGDCSAGSGADRIVLTGVVELDSVYEELANGPNGLPRILSEVVLDGRGHWIFRDPGADTFRFFEVAPSGILTLDDVILFGGYGSFEGGAIFNDGGVVHLKRSTLWFNEAPGDGGAVFNDGTLSAEDSSLLDNSSNLKGGAVYNTFGSAASMLRTTLKGNEARIEGGAISNQSHGTLALSKCTVEGNEAIGGGGIANWGNLTVVSSLFSDNEALSGGGGGLKVQNGFGTEAYIVDSTFSGNKAASGGAIHSGDSLTVELSTFSGNEADGPLPPIYAGIDADPLSGARVESTIMANSIGGDAHCSELYIEDGLNNFGCHGDEVTGLDATLKDNGGLTETHALLNASNAIDAAGACDIPADQRGIPREGDCDSGAFEYGECVDFVLRDEQVTTHRPLSICEYFWLGPGLNVWGPSGHLRATVGKKIIIRNGFSVRQNGQLTITLDPDLLPP